MLKTSPTQTAYVSARDPDWPALISLILVFAILRILGRFVGAFLVVFFETKPIRPVDGIVAGVRVGIDATGESYGIFWDKKTPFSTSSYLPHT